MAGRGRERLAREGGSEMQVRGGRGERQLEEPEGGSYQDLEMQSHTPVTYTQVDIHIVHDIHVCTCTFTCYM